MQEKISDTSLFAELVKDKHKRKKVLQDILDQKNNGDNSADACVIINDSSAASLSSTNGISMVLPPTEIVEIADDVVDNSVNVPQRIQVITSMPSAMALELPPPPLPPPMVFMPTAVINSAAAAPAPTNNNIDPKAIAMTPKVKSLTQHLPLPPGTNLSELANAKTPSPPHSPSDANNSKPKEATPAVPKAKKSLLNLPMPAMVAGSEDVSGDEDLESPRKAGGANGGRILSGKKKIVARPVILNRRNSRSAVGPGPGGLDWGERSVDVFQVLDQIGEGTYGQVSVAKYA